MGKEDPQGLIFDISTITRDPTKQIEFKDVPRKIGKDIYTRDMWEKTCVNLFNKKYKDAKIITIPSDLDKIMDTFSKLCLENQGRGFIFKDYDMLDHLLYLGYSRAMLKQKLGAILENSIKIYLAYIERMNVIFLCCTVKSDSSVFQCMNFITTSIKYFLILYNKMIGSTEVKIVGLLIQENEAKEKHFECAFCNLFSPKHEVFESPRSFKKWWSTVENYRNWWDLSNPLKLSKLFDVLAAQILGYIEKKNVCSPGLIYHKQLDRENFIYNKEVVSSTETGKLTSEQIQKINYHAPANPTKSSNDDTRKTLVFNKKHVSSTEIEKLISEQMQQTNHEAPANPTITRNDDTRNTIVCNKGDVFSTKIGKLISNQIQKTNYQAPENSTIKHNGDARKNIVCNKGDVSSTEIQKLISEQIQQTNHQAPANQTISSNDDAIKTIVFNKKHVSSTEIEKLISEQMQQTNHEAPANPTITRNDDTRNTIVCNKGDVFSTKIGKLISNQIQKTNYQAPENSTIKHNGDARKNIVCNKGDVSSTEIQKLISEQIQQTNHQAPANQTISSNDDAIKTIVGNKEVVSSTEKDQLISEQIHQTKYQVAANATMPGNDDSKKTVVLKLVVEAVGQGIRFRQKPQSSELNYILELDNPEQSNFDKVGLHSEASLEASGGNPNHSISEGIPIKQHNISEKKNAFWNKGNVVSKNMEETTFQQDQLSEDDVDHVIPKNRHDVKHKSRDSSCGNCSVPTKERLF